MNLILFGLFVLFLVAIQFTGGKTVDEIIENYIRAIGGIGKLGAIKSIYYEGLLTMMGNTALIKIYQYKENPDIESYTIQWQIADLEDNQYQTLQSTLSTQNLDKKVIECITQFAITAPLINYIEEGNKVLLVGKDVVDEFVCNKITLTTRADMEINYWFKKNDGLLHQTAIKSIANSAIKTMGMRSKYAEYKVLQGFLVAHKIEIVLAGSPAFIEINLNKIILNEPLEVNFVNIYN